MLKLAIVSLWRREFAGYDATRARQAILAAERRPCAHCAAMVCMAER